MAKSLRGRSVDALGILTEDKCNAQNHGNNGYTLIEQCKVEAVLNYGSDRPALEEPGEEHACPKSVSRYTVCCVSTY